MRFRGGGVGHRATREHTESMSQEADTTIPDENEEIFEDDALQEEEGPGEEWEDDESSSESDVEEGEHSEVEEDLDVEDGEEPWGINEYTAEGYAPP